MSTSVLTLPLPSHSPFLFHRAQINPPIGASPAKTCPLWAQAWGAGRQLPRRQNVPRGVVASKTGDPTRNGLLSLLVLRPAARDGSCLDL